MQFTTLIAAAATLALGANAAAIRRDGARLAQFRVFGAEGCSALNYGFYTVDESDVGLCKGITNVPTAVTSLNLEGLYAPAANGCNFYIYTDTDCSAGRRSISVDVCNNPLNPGDTWGSWQISCPSGMA
ncbi:hypothetical protein F5Y19DRAFT_282097 [Xylariaceae sp. FL1651]|nr:hypothetical protein F5Y19DRAFT_282097 [Xylariaceae sp. FL1651]